MDLAEHIFPDSRDAVRKLSNDRDTCFLMAKQVGQEIMEGNKFIAGFSSQTLAAIMSQAWFATDENECLTMSTMITILTRSKDILPLVSVHRSKSLASRCIVSLGLFKKAMETRHRLHGCPQPSFYRQVGITEFRKNEMNDISEHFLAWEGFLNEMFVLEQDGKII